MKFRRQHHVPLMSTTATADISFMLLIFFLLTSSMSQDKGLVRKLPPVANNSHPSIVDIEKDKVLKISVNAANELELNDETCTPAEAESRIAQFVTERKADHVLTIQTTPDTPYDYYFQVQLLVRRAYQSARNTLAHNLYHHSFEKCSAAQKDNIIDQLPQRIAEPSQR